MVVDLQVDGLVDEKHAHGKLKERANGDKPDWQALVVVQTVLSHCAEHDAGEELNDCVPHEADRLHNVTVAGREGGD